ncbi:unnamed protein product [Closterium sp. NIES-53]
MASSLLLQPRAVRLAANPLSPHNAVNPRNAMHSSLTQRPVVRAACARSSSTYSLSRPISSISASKPSTQLSALCPAAGLPDLRLRSRSSAKRSFAQSERPTQRLAVSASAASAAAPAPAESEKPKFTWAGAAPIPFIISVGVGLAVRFLVPDSREIQFRNLHFRKLHFRKLDFSELHFRELHLRNLLCFASYICKSYSPTCCIALHNPPASLSFTPVPAGVTTQAWQLLAIFLSTITGLVLGPLPVGAWAFVCLTFTVLSKTLSFAAAFSAMTNEVIWLIVISFFFARGFVKTGLGDRVATYFVKWFGKSTLGLSYGLAVSEALISLTMPSTTARAGGVFLPIISSLARSLPNDPTSVALLLSSSPCIAVSEALISPTMPSTTARAGGVFLPISRPLLLPLSCFPCLPPSSIRGAHFPHHAQHHCKSGRRRGAYDLPPSVPFVLSPSSSPADYPSLWGGRDRHHDPYHPLYSRSL